MPEYCGNCDAEFTDGGFIKSPNYRLKKSSVELVNFVEKTEYSELCSKCGGEIVNATHEKIRNKINDSQSYVANSISDFPMFTVHDSGAGSDCKLIGMVTANVTVGTGFFNEFSQGFSDFFGQINAESGMAGKVNSGEAAARSIVVRKALALGANCIFGVDIDYGTTANNAATINIQGTAAVVANLQGVMDARAFERSQKLQEAITNATKYRKWMDGDFSSAG